MSSALWSVAAVVRESPEVVRRFVSWYLGLGAREIFLIFENPYDLVIGEIVRQPRVHVIRGTSAFWRHINVTPEHSVMERRDRALHYVYSICQTPWLVLSEIDDLILTRDRSVGRILGAQPDPVKVVQIQVADRIFAPKEPEALYFRLPLPNGDVKRGFAPELSQIVAANGGYAGDAPGRLVVQTDIPGFVLKNGEACGRRGKPLAVREIGWEDGAVAQNFHSDSYEDWCSKLPARIDAGAYAPALVPLLEQALVAGEDELKKLWRGLYQIGARERSALMKRGLVLAADPA